MTLNVYLCSFKGTHPGWHGVVNRGIRLATKSQYSHTEVAVGHPFVKPALCVSATGLDGGVRAKTLQMSPDKWDILPMQWLEPDAVYNFLHDYNAEPYDYWGTGRFALPFLLREHPRAWFCSEAAASMAGFIDPWRFDPASLHAAVASRLKK